MEEVEESSWRKCGYFGKIVISGTILSGAPSLVFDSLPEEFLLIAFIVSSGGGKLLVAQLLVSEVDILLESSSAEAAFLSLVSAAFFSESFDLIFCSRALRASVIFCEGIT